MSKLRKIHLDDVEYGWSIAKQDGHGDSELRIWDTTTKQIIERVTLADFQQITPGFVLEQIKVYLKK